MKMEKLTNNSHYRFHVLNFLVIFALNYSKHVLKSSNQIMFGFCITFALRKPSNFFVVVLAELARVGKAFVIRRRESYTNSLQPMHVSCAIAVC
jgi:hypothetical protein